MTRLDQFNRYLRQTDWKEIRNFNLLFYGPPGTGKSELAGTSPSNWTGN